MPVSYSFSACPVCAAGLGMAWARAEDVQATLFVVGLFSHTNTSLRSPHWLPNIQAALVWTTGKWHTAKLPYLVVLVAWENTRGLEVTWQW